MNQMLDNYPPGMTTEDYIHVGEYPDPNTYCDMCGERLDPEEDDWYEEDNGIYCEHCHNIMLEE